MLICENFINSLCCFLLFSSILIRSSLGFFIVNFCYSSDMFHWDIVVLHFAFPRFGALVCISISNMSCFLFWPLNQEYHCTRQQYSWKTYLKNKNMKLRVIYLVDGCRDYLICPHIERNFLAFVSFTFYESWVLFLAILLRIFFQKKKQQKWSVSSIRFSFLLTRKERHCKIGW